ncbi:MAG: DUF2785 domain-containing protein [Nocardioidaceae bacterium]|nr:DUF2785 domain-containing protein [Nocardioidaceae bacterium]
MADWEDIRAHQFAVPDGVVADELLPELVSMLASPDPVLRDEIAMTALATWIDDGAVSDARLRPLGDLMVERFGSDGIQARTFASLVLDVIIGSRDVCEAGWVDAFESWYASETDLRGHDVELGWLHAVAHGADLLGTLGRRSDVGPGRMLGLGMARMLAPTAEVWHDQEHDRLAHGLAKVLARPDLSVHDASAWLDRADTTLSDRPPGPVPVHVSNTLHTLRMLYVLVDRGVRIESTGVLVVPHRDAVLHRIAGVLHHATPWMW